MILFCPSMTKQPNGHFWQNWVFTTTRFTMSIPTHKKCKTHEFTILNPQKFSWKNQVLCTSQWEPSWVIGNYLELISMSICLFCHGRAVLVIWKCCTWAFSLVESEWKHCRSLLSIEKFFAFKYKSSLTNLQDFNPNLPHPVNLVPFDAMRYSLSTSTSNLHMISLFIFFFVFE